ncbi:MAG TPA: hypothetical protein DCY98_07190 [Nitrospinae bacterium]|nr:hypothetical protein [Nitrospinota bacterium]
MRTQKKEDKSQTTDKNNVYPLFSVLCLLSSVFFFIAGCGGPLKQLNVSSYEFYRSPQVNKIDGNRIGFLTTALSRVSGLGEYKVTISDIIEKAFQKEKPKINIISSRETINSINTADLTDIYSKMLDYYDTTGILKKDYLWKVGDALKVRHIIQPKLLSFTESVSSRFSFFGLSIVSTRETTVKISLQLWDTVTGNVIWEGSGQATVAIESMRAKPVTFEEVAEAASLSVVKKFPF